MTTAQAILMGFGVIAAAILISNGAPPVGAEGTGPIIPPVEGFVPPGDSASANGPWHLWRMNRHTGQVSFCTADMQPMAGQSTQGAPSGQPVPVAVACTKTSGPM